jgi:hypothetical protein
MKYATIFAAGFLFLASDQASAGDSGDCSHTDILLPPSGCATSGTEENAAYKRGYRNGVFIANYAFDSYEGECFAWDDISDLIDDVKDYFAGISGYDSVDFCRLGGITDGISDRKAELGGGADGCCATLADCGDRGAAEGPQYADTYCMMVTAAQYCFDPGVYTRGPVADQCEDLFELYCDYYFAVTAINDTDCYKYTNNSPPPLCLEPFVNYRDYICDIP